MSALAIAGWARYLTATPEAQVAPDASLDQARSYATLAAVDPGAFLDFEAVFPASLAGNQRFRGAFVDAYALLAEGDILGAVANALAGQVE